MVKKKGSNASESLNGTTINDVLVTLGGSDTSRGFAGDDVLAGGAGAGRLHGGAGNDRLFGDNGVDKLAGGIGNDGLTGGAQSDIFVFQNGFGRDIIRDFNANGVAHDLIDLSGVSGITTYYDLRTHHLSEHGDDVWIVATGNRLVVEDVNITELGRQHFDLA